MKKKSKIGRPPKKPADKRSKLYGFKVTPDELARLKKLTTSQARDMLLAAADALTGKRKRG